MHKLTLIAIHYWLTYGSMGVQTDRATEPNNWKALFLRKKIKLKFFGYDCAYEVHRQVNSKFTIKFGYKK